MEHGNLQVGCKPKRNKREKRETESRDARCRGGWVCSSDEGSVMGPEQRNPPANWQGRHVNHF